MKVKSESEIAQSCPTPSDPMDCILPCPSIHGIFQERVLEWVAIAFEIVLVYIPIVIYLLRVYYSNHLYNDWASRVAQE